MKIIARIIGVRVDESGERPRLVLGLVEENGAMCEVLLDRKDAQELSDMFGPHPVIEAFFREGKGVQ